MTDLSSLLEHFPYLGLSGLIILGGIGLPFPEDATLLLAGFLLAHGYIKFSPAFAVIYFWLLLSDLFLYAVGRRYGRRLVEKRGFQRLISLQRLEELEGRFRKRGVWVVFLGRHLLGLRAQLFLAAGAMRIPTLQFLAADAASALFTMGFWGWVGYQGGSSILALREDISRVEHAVLLGGLVILVIAGFIRYVKAYGKK